MNIDLKLAILHSGLTQCALAKKIGVSEPTMSHFVRGWIVPNEGVKKQLARALNCEPAQIFPNNTTSENRKPDIAPE